MIQYILSIAGAVTQPTQQLDKLRMDSVNAGLDNGPFTLLLDGSVYLPAGLFDHFLNPGGMNPSVGNQPFQGDPGNLSADRVEAGQGDSLGGVVNNQINAGHGLDGPDITALAANDAALHFVVRQGHNRNGGFRHVIGGASLNGQGNDLAGLVVRVILCLLLDFHDFDRFFMNQFVFQFFQQIILGLVNGESGDSFQHFKLAFFDGFRFRESFVDFFGLCVNGLFFCL